VFHLNCNSNCHTRTLPRTKWGNQCEYWIFAALSCCESWCSIWNDRNLRCFVPLRPKICYQSVYCFFIWYFFVSAFLNTLKRAAKNSIRNVCQWTHFLLMTAPCLHLHRFCATSVGSGLATRMTLIRVPRRLQGMFTPPRWNCFWFNICSVVY
jgi:hypothetical protein